MSPAGMHVPESIPEPPLTCQKLPRWVHGLKLLKVCHSCHRVYEVEKKRYDTSLYCSNYCRRKQHAVVCNWCGKTFSVQRYRRDNARFCSLQCVGAYVYNTKLRGRAFDQTGITPPNKKFASAKDRNRWWANHYRQSPKGKLTDNFRGALNKAIRRKGVTKSAGKRWEEIVGYSIDELKANIEKKLRPGMTWDNYGEWHIDHKIPVSAFNYTSVHDIDFRKCWSLKNLQPMWASDNQSKNCRLEKPFQPSLGGIKS